MYMCLARISVQDGFVFKYQLQVASYIVILLMSFLLQYNESLSVPEGMEVIDTRVITNEGDCHLFGASEVNVKISK